MINKSIINVIENIVIGLICAIDNNVVFMNIRDL